MSESRTAPENKKIKVMEIAMHNAIIANAVDFEIAPDANGRRHFVGCSLSN